MEEMKNLVTKHITSEHLEKASSLSNKPSPRQAALIVLIQRTQQRRGLPAISAGYELQSALRNWESALKNIPDAYLSRAYEHAADNWNWQDKSHPFTEDAIADAYKVLVVEDRQRAEAEKRNARRKDDTYRCWRCCDVGYQVLFTRTESIKLWYSSLRPCSCEAAPAGQRQEFPLDESVWVRSKYGEYARRVDIDKYGVPNDGFKDAITSR